MRTVIQVMCVAVLVAAGTVVADTPSSSFAAAEENATVESVVGFANTFASYDELFEALETAVRSGDPELMRALTVSEVEFRDLVWPTLDLAAPKSNFTWEFVWSQHLFKHEKCLLRTSHDYADAEFDIIGVEFNGRTTDHGTFKIHRDSEVEIIRPDGTRESLALFGSLLETAEGRYKIYSFIND